MNIITIYTIFNFMVFCQVGDVVTFKIEIEVTSCPKNIKDRNQTLQIYPVGLNESLMVDLEMICGCPCEDKNHKVSVNCLFLVKLMGIVCLLFIGL